MVDDERVAESLKARAEKHKAVGRWVAASTAALAALYSTFLMLGVVVAGEGPRLFNLPPATPDEALATALLVVVVGGMTAVLRAVVSIWAPGRRRQWAVLAFAAVTIVPLSVAFRMEAPLVASVQMAGLFITASVVFAGMFAQDELAIKAESLEELAKDQDCVLRRQERTKMEDEIKQLRAEIECLQRREDRPRLWWCLRGRK